MGKGFNKAQRHVCIHAVNQKNAKYALNNIFEVRVVYICKVFNVVTITVQSKVILRLKLVLG